MDSEKDNKMSSGEFEAYLSKQETREQLGDITTHIGRVFDLIADESGSMRDCVDRVPEETLNALHNIVQNIYTLLDECSGHSQKLQDAKAQCEEFLGAMQETFGW